MNPHLRAALRLIVDAPSYASLCEAYRSLEASPLNKDERELIAGLFNSIVHHMIVENGRAVAS
jgi:hypothetical protein